MYSSTPTKAALTVNAFCEALSIGRTLFYERVRLGEIKVVKIGTRTLVPIGEVQAFLERAVAAQS